jgi:hypothetical protein
MGSSKNALNKTLKMGHLVNTVVFSVLVIVMILVCDFFIISCRELRRPIFPEGVFGPPKFQPLKMKRHSIHLESNKENKYVAPY